MLGQVRLRSLDFYGTITINLANIFFFFINNTLQKANNKQQTIINDKLQLIVLIRTAVATAHALPVNAIAKQAGRVKGATRSISRCTNAYPVALTTARTISNPEAASARDTGPVSIVHNQAVASIVGHTVPANRVFASQYAFCIAFTVACGVLSSFANLNLIIRTRTYSVGKVTRVVLPLNLVSQSAILEREIFLELKINCI